MTFCVTFVQSKIVSFFLLFFPFHTFSDSFINKEEYLDYQKDCYQKLVGLEMPEFRIRIEERIFADMDRSNSGQIDWWQYQIPMCVRKLTARKKVTS